MAPQFSCKILLVEDDASDASLVRQSLRSAVNSSFDIAWVKCLAEAQNYLQEYTPDVVLLDLTLPDSSGLDTVCAGRLAAGDLPLIVLTGHNDPEFALQTLDAGAQDYLVKGAFEADQLIRTIRYAISRAKLEQGIHETEERWRLALEAAGDGVWDWDIRSDTVLFSPQLKEMLGLSETEMENHIDAWVSRIHPEDAERVSESLRTYLTENSGTYKNEHRLRCKDDSWKWMLHRGMVVNRSVEGDPLRMVGTFTDITTLKQAEEMMRLSSTVFNTVDEAILVSNAENRIITVNVAFTRVTGYSQEEVIGENPHILSSGQHDAEFYTALWKKLEATGSWSGELYNRRKTGEIYVEWTTIKQVHDPAGKLTHYVAAFSDITERKAIEENIRHQAEYDALTDLPNRVLLFDRLRRALATAKRNKTRLALMYLDLDKFKPINDNLGHAIGDEVLQQVASRMQGCMREADTVARIGGDEFVVLLPIIDDEVDALVVAEKIRLVLNEPFEIGGENLRISSSTGIAIYPDHGLDEDELTGNADIAMYHAKESGRDRVMLFNKETMRDKV